MNKPIKTISAADIVFPDDDPSLPPVLPSVVVGRLDMDAIEHDVWHLLSACDTLNRNDQLVVAIKALIAAGVNTKPRVIGAATRLGFNRGHAGATLSKSEGSDPDRHRWQLGPEGVYRLHAAAAA